MLGAHMTGTIIGTMTAAGLIGTSVPSFAMAVGDGSITPIIGAPFTTTDIGTVPGAGVGTGVGLTGPVDSLIAQAIFVGLVSKFGSAGDSLLDITDSVAGAFVAELALATLTSTHTPVFAGSGTIVVGSISVPASAIADMIEQSGVASGFLGDSWPDIAEVIGQEFSSGLALATGSLVIAGAPTGTPAPGAGTGSGSIS
jgi:hypothetical protein